MKLYKSRSFGYTRVSTKAQQEHLETQIERLKERGIPTDKIISDVGTGTTMTRRKIMKLIKDSPKGTTILIATVDRLGRNHDNNQLAIEEAEKRGVRIVIDEIEKAFTYGTAKYNMTFTALSHLAQSEQALRQKATSEGIKKNHHKYKHKQGRPEIDHEIKRKALKMYSENHTVDDICNTLGIGRTTFYKIKKADESGYQE